MLRFIGILSRYLFFLLLLLCCLIHGADETNEASAQLKGATQDASSEGIDIEMDVLGFRLWMIIAFVMAGLLVIVIILCCIFDCRVPRTKQEIEQDRENSKKKTAEGFDNPIMHHPQGLPPNTSQQNLLAARYTAQPGMATGQGSAAMPRSFAGQPTGQFMNNREQIRKAMDYEPTPDY